MAYLFLYFSLSFIGILVDVALNSPGLYVVVVNVFILGIMAIPFVWYFYRILFRIPTPFFFYSYDERIGDFGRIAMLATLFLGGVAMASYKLLKAIGMV